MRRKPSTRNSPHRPRTDHQHQRAKNADVLTANHQQDRNCNNPGEVESHFKRLSFMPLTQTQHEQFVAWMEDHVPEYQCPMCHRDHFETGEVIAGLSIDPAGVIQTQGPMNPMVQVRCVYCRFVALFEAIPMGLLPEGVQTNPDW